MREFALATMVSLFVQAVDANPCFYPEGGVDGGLVSGEMLANFDARGRVDYITGVVDGLIFSNELEQPNLCVEGLVACIGRHGADGLIALIDEHVLWHSIDWPGPAPIGIAGAINSICSAAS